MLSLMAGFPLGVVHSTGCDKCMTCTHHYGTPESFHCPKNPLGSACSSLPPPTTGIFYLLEWYIVGIVHFVTFPTSFLHLVICIYASSMSFQSLIASFFLSMNNIPLSKCTTVHLHIYLLQNTFQVLAITN